MWSSALTTNTATAEAMIGSQRCERATMVPPPGGTPVGRRRPAPVRPSGRASGRARGRARLPPPEMVEIRERRLGRPLPVVRVMILDEIDLLPLGRVRRHPVGHRMVPDVPRMTACIMVGAVDDHVPAGEREQRLHVRRENWILEQVID